MGTALERLIHTMILKYTRAGSTSATWVKGVEQRACPALPSHGCLRGKDTKMKKGIPRTLLAIMTSACLMLPPSFAVSRRTALPPAHRMSARLRLPRLRRSLRPRLKLHLRPMNLPNPTSGRNRRIRPALRPRLVPHPHRPRPPWLPLSAPEGEPAAPSPSSSDAASATWPPLRIAPLGTRLCRRVKAADVEPCAHEARCGQLPAKAVPDDPERGCDEILRPEKRAVRVNATGRLPRRHCP